MDFNEHYLLDELEVLIDGKYHPGRPAPYCNGHDDPRFSDPGDPAEVYDMAVYLEKNGKRLDITEYLDDVLLNDMRNDMIEHMEEMA